MFIWHLEKSLAIYGQNKGPLSYSPEKICEIIIANMLLHNICINHGLFTDMDTLDEPIHVTDTPILQKKEFCRDKKNYQLF